MDQELQARLARGEALPDPVAVVVAHPDDEILWIGNGLRHLGRLHLIHLTDGAPRDLRDARRAGFQTWQQYAAARRLELYRALQTIQVHPRHSITHDIADQETAEHLIPIIERLTEQISGMRAVITHSYEHGHPDHDSTALAVHAARALLERRGEKPPCLIEFAAYHMRDGQLRYGEFWPMPDVAETVVVDTVESRTRKGRALSCFVSQREVLKSFAPEHERIRAAPRYDFTEPAPPADALYDAYGWRITSVRWRQCARAALEHFNLSGAL